MLLANDLLITWPINPIKQGHAEALRCLKGRHLLFLGDSLSR